MFKSVPGCIEGIPGHYGMFGGIMGCSRGVPGLFRAVPGCSGGVPGVFRVLQTPLSQRFRDGDRKTNMTSARQVVLDNYTNSRRHTIILVVICATACASARNFFEMARLIFDSKDSSIYV